MPKPNLNKTKISLTVNKEILEASRQYIPNLSHFLETKLREFLYSVNHPISKGFEWTRRDSNPRPSPCEGDALPLSYEPKIFEEIFNRKLLID